MHKPDRKQYGFLHMLSPLANYKPGQKLALRMPSLNNTFFIGLLLLMAAAFLSTSAKAELNITLGYLEYYVPPPPILSNLDEIPAQEGLLGAKLGIADNATTGKFLKHQYAFETRRAEDDQAFVAAAIELLKITPILVVNAPRQQLLKLAHLPQAKQAILFNAAAMDDELRDLECSANLFHTIPSRAMLADAISQFSVTRKWTRWVMIFGDKPGDLAFAESIRKSASKFHINLEAEKQWSFNADMRRNASAEVPLFTQDFPDYDLMIIADEIGDFGRYIMYNTWLPRPVAGSEGMVASGWSASVEQNGAAQLQSRFADLAHRPMTSVDYAAWAAVRSIGEAVTRTNSADAATLRQYMLSDNFELAGFKGRKMTFRNWNGQLRQPIPLSHSRAVVALAPLDGFLHERDELDTLGPDRPESACKIFGEAK